MNSYKENRTPKANEGKVDVSELSTEKASASSGLPCVSDRPTDFSFSAAVKTSISRASLGEEEISTGLPEESILNPAEDTAFVFDVAVKVEQEENENVDVTVTAEVEQVGDVTTAVDDTMMIFIVPSRKSSDFPAHFGTAVETSISRASLGEEEISTGSPKESILNPADDTASVCHIQE
ncbi:hypothetical protein Q1695_001380 [Nippostrongylus brasiliensis]|nr:hypothetical protein Q1695_001380 [Nippostrongylus brasiliensis]